jgi:uncharacterized SAM-binding protein YcdF (DUF218 family)
MPEPLIASIMPYPRAKRMPLWVSAVGIVLFGGALILLNLGRWLVSEDPLQKATAIAVLSGRMPDRALEAARIYHQGYAPKVWLTYSKEPGATLAKLSVKFVGEEELSKQVLIHEGVPETAIIVLEPPIMNTADEMRTIGDELAKEGHGYVIIVTSKVHTRRVRALWNKLAGQDGIAVMRGVSDDTFDEAHWWKTTRDALDVVREILGLFNAWAGLPLKPATPN